MDKQTVVAFIFIGAILIIWLYLNSPKPPLDQPVNQKDTTHVVADTIQKPIAIEQEKEVFEEIYKDTTSLGMHFRIADGKERIITVENDLVTMEISTRGANIKKYFLKEFKNWYSADSDSVNFSTMVQLINYPVANAYDIAFVTSDGKAVNTGQLHFESSAKKSRYKLSGTDSLTLEFTLKAENKGEIKKIYTFYGDAYNIISDIHLVGMNNIIGNNAYDVVWESGIRSVEKNSADEANYSDASVYYGDEQVIVDAADLNESIEKEFNGKVDWLNVRNKYFTAIIAPQNPDRIEGAYIKGLREEYGKNGIKEIYSGRLIVPFKNTNLETSSFNIYIGPVDYDILKKYGNNLEAIVNFGSFFGLKFIVRPIAEYVLLPLFTFLHSFIPNYGMVIIVFSIIIKVVLYPLTKQSLHSMKKMQMLQPKIAELKEKYKEDAQKMNKETMKLYSTYGVNPAGGCFPLILQMPIFIALWGLFQVAIELRQKPFFGWITDLSRPDIIYQLPFKLPIFGIDQVAGLAILMGVTTFFQQKMSVKDPKQQMLVYIMPVMLTILFMSFPSGLNLYYFMFNILSIAQQYYINHKHDGMVLEPVKNPKKQKGFMAKLLEAAEQNTKQQQRKRR
ncbi:MAG: preprotein translocase YidC [Ignavibacteria bacterium GWA2_35_9]|nr:MAG: preprotein translocase YidC [Ignavibacteria bacterium GWA2_35_9]